MINTKFILGEAGTAKTSTIIDTLDELNDYVCLALTHSAVKNMCNKFITKYTSRTPEINIETSDIEISYLEDHFKTIHSFFRLKFDENGNEIYQLNQNINVPDYIFIDEISLVPLTIINIIYQTILKNISSERTVNLILVGDLLQLNPISKINNLIDYHKLFSVPNINMGFQESMLIASHLSNNIFSTDYYQNSSKIVLTKNYRSNTKVLNILNEVITEFKRVKKYIIRDPIKMVNDGYIVLSSRYDYLKEIYQEVDKSCYEFNVKSDIGMLYFNDGDELLLTKNLDKHFVNGDRVKIYFKNNTIELYNGGNVYYFIHNSMERYPLLPPNFITVHKAQGLSLDKVLVILDDMFEITMLYTAITRAINDVKFVALNKIPTKKMNLYNKSFNTLKSILY